MAGNQGGGEGGNLQLRCDEFGQSSRPPAASAAPPPRPRPPGRCPPDAEPQRRPSVSQNGQTPSPASNSVLPRVRKGAGACLSQKVATDSVILCKQLSSLMVCSFVPWCQPPQLLSGQGEERVYPYPIGSKTKSELVCFRVDLIVHKVQPVGGTEDSPVEE